MSNPTFVKKFSKKSRHIIQTYKKHWLNPKHSQCIWLIFFDMFPALIDDRTDVIICQGIKN